MKNISPILKIAGIVLLLGGIQSLSFHRYIAPRFDKAEQNLAFLQEEVPGNQLLNTSLDTLRDYRRISNDEVKKRQILQLRQDFVQQFREDPRPAIEDLNRVVSSFEAQSTVEQELLDTLQKNLSHLKDIYSDHYAAVIANYDSPPWYFQPSAAFLTMRSSDRQELDFNHALYLMLVAQRAAANPIYNELRLNVDSDAFKSRIFFAQSRLQYDAFRLEQDPEYYHQAVLHAQQSLAHDAAYDLARLFLEYLLTIDLQAVGTESAPSEEQGSGEAQGERGAVSTEPPEH